MVDFKNSGLFEKINQLGKIIHDDQIFKEIQSILAKFKNTQQRRNLLAPNMLQDVICFDKVKNEIWKVEIDSEKNRFPFLQGDIVATKSVLVPGQAHSAGEQSLWLVKSADCDIARVEPFIETSRNTAAAVKGPKNLVKIDTTGLYDRRSRKIAISEIERIGI